MRLIVLLLMISFFSCQKSPLEGSIVTFDYIFVEKMPDFFDTITTPSNSEAWKWKSALYCELTEDISNSPGQRIFNPAYNVETSYSALLNEHPVTITRIGTTFNFTHDTTFVEIEPHKTYYLKIYHDYESVPVRAVVAPFPDKTVLLDVIKFSSDDCFINRNNQFTLEQGQFKLVIGVK